MILPGWDNLESARTIHASFEFAGLLFFAALVLFEILDHREKRQTKRKKLFKILALTSFAIAVFCEIVAFPYSRRVDELSEKRDAQLESRINDDSNLLAQAQEAASSNLEAISQLKPKSLKERIIDCLNSIDKRIVPQLAKSTTSFSCSGPMDIIAFSQLKELAAEPDAGQYLQISKLPDSTGLGIGNISANGVEFWVYPALLKKE